MSGAAPSTFLPTPDQESFLDLVFSSQFDPQSLDATLNQFDLERLDPELNSLFPLLAVRWGDRLPAVIKEHATGIHQFIAFQNRLLLARLARVIQLLEEAGIRTLVLKGCALIVDYYQDPGLRFMRDGDLMIAPQCVEPALSVLQREGWRWAWPPRLSPLVLRTQHSIDMVHANGTKLDLHWTPINATWHPGNTIDFWNASHPCSFHNVTSRAFCAADQLFHACIHGIHYSNPRGVRWIADVITILQNAPQLDWNRFVHQSKVREFTLWTVSALAYLRDRFGVHVPPEVIEQLLGHNVSDFVKADFAALTQSRESINDLGRARLFWRRYRALVPDHSALRCAVEFPFYIRHDMQAPGFSYVLRQLIRGRLR